MWDNVSKFKGKISNKTRLQYVGEALKIIQNMASKIGGSLWSCYTSFQCYSYTSFNCFSASNIADDVINVSLIAHKLLGTDNTWNLQPTKYHKIEEFIVYLFNCL